MGKEGGHLLLCLFSVFSVAQKEWEIFLQRSPSSPQGSSYYEVESAELCCQLALAKLNDTFLPYWRLQCWDKLCICAPFSVLAMGQKRAVLISLCSHGTTHKQTVVGQWAVLGCEWEVGAPDMCRHAWESIALSYKRGILLGARSIGASWSSSTLSRWLRWRLPSQNSTL